MDDKPACEDGWRREGVNADGVLSEQAKQGRVSGRKKRSTVSDREIRSHWSLSLYLPAPNKTFLPFIYILE